jgi:pimeloyl-ACP methyl ester carboxylesterase
MWSPNVADFSKVYRVYAIDTMGQPSKSTPDPDEPIRSAADFVTWLSEVLNGLNLDRIFLGGMSYGGWIALNFAMSVPQCVRKLVLLSPAASFQPLARQFTLRMIPMGLYPTRFTVNSLFGWMGFNVTSDNPEDLRILDLMYLGMKHFRFPPESSRIMLNMVPDDELRALDVPVLLLIGENEVIYDPAKALARAHLLIPDFQGELVPQCNHDMVSSQHHIVDARVLDFLNDN